MESVWKNPKVITKETISNLYLDPTIPEGLRWLSDQAVRSPAGTPCGSLCKKGYYSTRVNGQTFLNHRLVYFIHTGDNPTVVDHINGNPADNRIENLRGCSRSENISNSKRRVDNTSGIKGLKFVKSKNQWVGAVNKNKKRYYTQYSSDKELVISQLVTLRNNLHKDFTRHD